MGQWRWEEETRTVRTIPENYCVTHINNFSDGGHTDAALSIHGVGRLIAAAPEMLEVLNGLHTLSKKLLEKYEPDSIDNEWLIYSSELLNKTKGKQ